MEYLIQESTLAQMANPLREKFVYRDAVIAFVSNKNKIIEFIIPDTVRHLSSMAFAGCNNLTNVTVPSGIITIEGNPFYNCANLTDIYFCSTTPPTIYSTSSFPTTATLHVPIGSSDAYKNATNWSIFANNIVEYAVNE